MWLSQSLIKDATVQLYIEGLILKLYYGLGSDKA